MRKFNNKELWRKETSLPDGTLLISMDFNTATEFKKELIDFLEDLVIEKNQQVQL